MGSLGRATAQYTQFLPTPAWKESNVYQRQRVAEVIYYGTIELSISNIRARGRVSYGSTDYRLIFSVDYLVRLHLGMQSSQRA